MRFFNRASKQADPILRLWQAHQASISRTLFAYEADPSARQDLKQDVYLALHQSAERVLAAENPRAYLFRILHNVSVDHIARAQRHKGEAWDEQPEPVATDACPASTVAAQQLSSQLMLAVRQLSPSHRQVVLLAMEDLDATEIAEILQLSHGAVRVRLTRAKTELMELMQHVR